MPDKLRRILRNGKPVTEVKLSKNNIQIKMLFHGIEVIPRFGNLVATTKM